MGNQKNTKEGFAEEVIGLQNEWLKKGGTSGCYFYTKLACLDTTLLITSSDLLSKSKLPARWTFKLEENNLEHNDSIIVKITTNRNQIWNDLDAINSHPDL